MAEATVPALYHPTVGVHDLDTARDWFRRVFGREPLRWEETLDLGLLNADYPVNYSFFAFVCDTHWVFLCPELHARGSLSGQKRYRTVREGMIGLGWYTDDAVALFKHLAQAGVRSHDQQGQRITGEKPPTSSFLPDVLTGFTEPADTGIRYEFQETGRRHWAKYSEKADLRLRRDWTGREVIAHDPLGLLLTSHHTIVTRDLPRALRLYVELLHAAQIVSGRNLWIGGNSTFVRLADTMLEFVVPNEGSRFYDHVADGHDLYHAVTYLVQDRPAVAAHLESIGIPHTEVGDAIVIAPENGLGVEWRFVTALPYPASERRAPALWRQGDMP
jgi:catechol 2,3-dioxygenase-like lactoylglutathione lyase family enzyme